MKEEKPKKVVFCTPSLGGPTPAYINALEQSIPLIKSAGWQEAYVQELGCPYISHARATMTRKALDADADVIVYLDYDLSWRPEDLLRLVNTEGDVIAGIYRYKKDEVEYMGTLKERADGKPFVRLDGCIRGYRVPGGFLKVTRNAIRRIMKAHPELVYGDLEHPSIDLFHHGAHEGVWYGEDMAFSRRWIALGGEIWIIPDLDLHHHSKDRVFQGNYHEYLLELGRKERGEVPA